MFLVFNKDKISSYLVVVSTMIILLFIGDIMLKNSNQIENKLENQNVISTSSSTNKLVPIYSVETNEKKVALTMNCAWNADDIEQILDILDRKNVKITFFMVGDWIDKYQDAIKKINEAGHEIANHSNTHPHVNNLTYTENVNEIQKCNDKIYNITGKKNKLYRAPYGEYNDNVLLAATDNNFYVIQWNIDTLDYNNLDSDQMIERINKKINNGSIILMHNGTENTANSLEAIIDDIKSKGYEIVTVSNLIYDDNYEIDSNGIQRKLSKE